MASLQFNYAGGRRPGKPQGVTAMRSPLFPYPAGYMARTINQSTQPLVQEERKTESLLDKQQPEQQQRLKELPPQPEPVLNTVMNQDNVQDLVPEAEPVKFQDDKQDNKQESKANSPAAEPEIKLNVSEQLVAFLENSEVGLNTVRSQVANIKLIFEDFMFTLDNFQSIMNIIFEQEQRRQNRPQATVSAQKESKDTVDQILELLQTPALQSLLRQFMLSIMTKVKTT